MRIGNYLREAILVGAYWITPNGNLIDCGGKNHIDFIVKSPEKFGLNRKEVEAEYDKNGEPYGFEGKARENIVIQVIKNGFIRIRKYKNMWSVNVSEWNKKSAKNLSNWAYGMLSGEYGVVERDKYIPVQIAAFKGNPPKNIDMISLSGLSEAPQLLNLITPEELEYLI
jgi:hypothetical protein